MSETATLSLSEKGRQVLDLDQGMTVLELVDLVKTMEKEFGVSAAAPVAVAAMPGAAPAAEEAGAKEEKTSFDVVLEAAGDKKIQVIKAIREVTSLGLKEAKDLVEGAPKPVKTGIPKEEADKIVKLLTESGAKAVIK
jgi:large subunit ribosomal protein L7/L12